MKKHPKTLRTLLRITLLVVLCLLVLVKFDKREEKVTNIIYMVGDGMGVAHISAAQIAKDYKPLNMERADYVGLCKTNSANSRVTDSAAAGTALATGHKTNNGMIGMTPDSVAHPSIRERAELAGMPTGIVVTYPVTNATPATFVGHVPNRHWEDDIATYYISNEVDVIIGGGSKRFDQRGDGRNLLDTLSARGYVVAKELAEIEAVESGKVVVLPTEDSTPSYLHGRGDFLPNATAKALEILTNNAQKSDSGFFLMVEGSQIDGKAHGHDLEGMLAEIYDFDAAVNVAFDYADEHPGTLVVVTADHETGGLTIVNGNRKFDIHDLEVDFAWTTGGHTGGMVPIFAYGTGAENFSGVLDNTDLPKIMCRLLGLDYEE
ncbi:MAG: alkaline phosphatase [Tidjanibacter sp.]|nr:alkaline phosphatase [Tidjanibacter sp.]